MSTDTITNDQIIILCTEAGMARDFRMAAICRDAINGDANARAKCARVIADAKAQEE